MVNGRRRQDVSISQEPPKSLITRDDPELSVTAWKIVQLKHFLFPLLFRSGAAGTPATVKA